MVALACELIAWTQLLAFTDHQARRWEPKRLRLRLFSAAARLVRSGRRSTVQLARHGVWTGLITAGITRLRELAAPG